MAHLDKAIKRVDEATHSLSKMQRELDNLAPVFEASKTDVQLRQEAVEACQKEYAAAKERCKKQEKDIEDMQGPIEILKKEAQAEFEKVRRTIMLIAQMVIVVPVCFCFSSVLFHGLLLFSFVGDS